MTIKEYKQLDLDEKIKVANSDITTLQSTNSRKKIKLDADAIWVYEHLMRNNVAPLKEKKKDDKVFYVYRKLTQEEIADKRNIRSEIEENIEKYLSGYDSSEEDTFFLEGLSVGCMIGLTTYLIFKGDSFIYLPLLMCAGMCVGQTIRKSDIMSIHILSNKKNKR